MQLHRECPHKLGKIMLVNLNPTNYQSINNNITKVVSKQCSETAYPAIKELSNYPISFCSTQVQRHSKGSTPYVAKELKALEGSLDEKLVKAKDIILKDMNLPSDLVECINQECNGYAAYSAPLGQIIINKKRCQNPEADFSDEAVICILRHELDHLEVFAKLYKSLGGEEFEKLLSALYGKDMPKVNHEFYKEMSKYVNTDNFDSSKYIDAINNYYKASLGKSHYKNFTDITKNFSNALEKSAQDKQGELESLMGVTTIKDFYSMIDETKKLVSEIKAKGITDENEIQNTFDNLFNQALESTGLEDKTQNWSKILKEARIINNQ